jgi:hypothetical protein
MYRGLLADERGMVPYSSLGVLMLLIVCLGVYHFVVLDYQRSQSTVRHIFDMGTFYSTTSVGIDLQQITTGAIKYAILNHSISTYGHPIDIDKEWETPSDFEEWKRSVENQIALSIREAIFRSYLQGNKSMLEERYSDQLTEFNFSDFLHSKSDIKVQINQDRYDEINKRQHALEAMIRFEGGGIVSSKNMFTNHEMSLNLSTAASTELRPFTMADKTYKFTRIFKTRAPHAFSPLCINPDNPGHNTVDEIAWYLWGAQEVMGIVEANLKHNIKFATDERASYSLMQLVIAYKELETFGTFDYVHIAIEFLRPWIGHEGEAIEFASMLKESTSEKSVQEAANMMDASLLVRHMLERLREISGFLIVSSSKLDSRTASSHGRGFPEEDVERLKLADKGVAQHIAEAEDISGLATAYSTIVKIKRRVEENQNNVESSAILPLDDELRRQTPIIKREVSEIEDKWTQASQDLRVSEYNIRSVKRELEDMDSWLSDEICNNPMAAMLWFGDENQNIKGLGEILESKIQENTLLLEQYKALDTALSSFHYDEEEDDYGIYFYYKSVISEIDDAQSSLLQAEAARAEYLNQKYKYDNCETHVDYRDRRMGGCLGSGYSCLPYDCNPYPCDCETDEEGTTLCDTCYMTCYHTCYNCVCDKNVLRRNFERAEVEYKGHMKDALVYLAGAEEDLAMLMSSIDTFYDDNGIDDFYRLLEETHGMYNEPTSQTLSQHEYSISDIYYAHWRFAHDPTLDNSLHDTPYLCAGKVISQGGLASPLAYDYAHKEYTDYGIYYLQYIAEILDKTMNDESLDTENLRKSKNALIQMKNTGYFSTLHSFIDYILELWNSAGDLKNTIISLKRAQLYFPNIAEHTYTTLPLPPVNASFYGYPGQGFSVIHDIRLRVDTRPGEVELPIIGEVSLGVDKAVNPSLPIPYTPINIYIWGFEITPSLREGEPEKSTLWLMDYDSSGLSPLLEMKIEDRTLPIPLFLHKPIMYKYEFTPSEIISKDIGLDYPPPIVVFALGPFTTRFGDYVEPPDKQEIEDLLAVDLSYSLAKSRLYLSTSEELSKNKTIYILTHLTENANHKSIPINSAEGTIKIGERTVFSQNSPEAKWADIPLDKLQLLKAYGWAEIVVDAYATDEYDSPLFGDSSDIEKMMKVEGEDHLRIPLYEDIEKISISVEKSDDSLIIYNNGDRRVDISVTGEKCVFIRPRLADENLTKGIWLGSLNSGEKVKLQIFAPERAQLTVEIEMPKKILELMQNSTQINSKAIVAFP